MKCKTDKPERHKDGSGHHHPMGVFPIEQQVQHLAVAPLSLFPLRLQPGVASRHRRACSLQPFGRHRLRQRELDYPATAAEPVAQREAPAAMSHSDNSFMQSHFLTFSPQLYGP